MVRVKTQIDSSPAFDESLKVQLKQGPVSLLVVQLMRQFDDITYNYMMIQWYEQILIIQQPLTMTGHNEMVTQWQDDNKNLKSICVVLVEDVVKELDVVEEEEHLVLAHLLVDGHVFFVFCCLTSFWSNVWRVSSLQSHCLLTIVDKDKN